MKERLSNPIEIKGYEVIVNYAKKQAIKARVQVERIRHNPGACRCANCTKYWVNTFNRYLALALIDPDTWETDEDVWGQNTYFVVHGRRGITIYSNREDAEKIKMIEREQKDDLRKSQNPNDEGNIPPEDLPFGGGR